jgi:microcystin-dependent protein
MALENATQIQELVPTNPEGGDYLAEADNHMRMIKLCLQTSFPGMTAPWTTTSPINAGDPVLPGDLVNLGFLQSFSNEPIGYPRLWLAPALPGVDWVAFEGQLLSRTEYAALFTLYGTAYGAGDGVSTFKLPDTRGLFPRFQDSGAGVDPDAATRTARADGAAGDNVGTTQADEFKAHNHGVRGIAPAGSGTTTGEIPGSSDIILSGNRGGTETRAKNMYFRLICKAK